MTATNANSESATVFATVSAGSFWACITMAIPATDDARSAAQPRQAVVICDDIDPDRWHGDIRLGRHVLLKTEAVPSYEQASRQVRDAYEAKVVEIFQR